MSLLAVRSPLGLVSGPSSSDSSMCRLGLFSVLVGRPSVSPATVIKLQQTSRWLTFQDIRLKAEQHAATPRSAAASTRD